MDKEKAMAVLADELGHYRAKSYVALKELIGQVDARDVEAPDGTVYQIEIQAGWDDKPNGDIRISGAIDDGGWRAFVPLCDDFIITPDGTLLGE